MKYQTKVGREGEDSFAPQSFKRFRVANRLPPVPASLLEQLERYLTEIEYEYDNRDYESDPEDEPIYGKRWGFSWRQACEILGIPMLHNPRVTKTFLDQFLGHKSRVGIPVRYRGKDYIVVELLSATGKVLKKTSDLEDIQFVSLAEAKHIDLTA